jgi:hypothetical protein
MLEALRANDIPGRQGGDEFVLLLRRTTPAQAMSVAQRITTAFEQPLLLDDHTVDLSAGLGIAVWPLHAADADANPPRARQMPPMPRPISREHGMRRRCPCPATDDLATCTREFANGSCECMPAARNPGGEHRNTYSADALPSRQGRGTVADAHAQPPRAWPQAAQAHAKPP